MQSLHFAHCFVLILFTINVGIVICFVYFHWYFKKDVTRVESGTRTQTTI